MQAAGNATGAGVPVTLTVRVPGKAGKALKRGKRVRLALTLTARNGAGQTAATNATLSVKGSKKKRRH